MRKAIALALLLLASVPLLVAVSELPPVGSTENPTYTHVVPRYLEEGEEEAGAENIVTAVILNYRGFDTNGEVTVIFTALVAVFGVLLLEGARGPSMGEPSGVPVSLVTSFIVRTIAPFGVLFSVYMILYGHVTPGGGFQGGTILGALVIALSLVLGRERAERLIPRTGRSVVQAAAVLTFVVVGVGGMMLGGRYLQFPGQESLAWLRTAGLTVLEAGIGVGGAAIIASLFWVMGEER